MGLLEIHFHDSEFVFRPSMRIGPSLAEDDNEEATESGEVGDDLLFPNDESEEGSNRPVLAAVLGLIVVGLLLRALRDRSAS